MNKRIGTIVIGLALFLAAGYVATGELMAEDQKNNTGFELSFHHVGISVANLDESIAWYKKMLGFEEVIRMDRGETIEDMKIAKKLFSRYIETQIRTPT